MKFSEGLQKIISFGYLYLIILGILQESVFYQQIEINILRYSTIADILISPIATLASRPIVLVSAVVLSIFSYVTTVFLSKRTHKKWMQRTFLKGKENLSEEEVGKYFTNLFVIFFAYLLLAFFLGLGLGSGSKLSEKIASNQLEYNSKMNFNSGGTEDIYLIGTNSLYYFYFTKGNQHVKISPIGTIKNLELTDNKKQNEKQKSN